MTGKANAPEFSRFLADGDRAGWMVSLQLVILGVECLKRSCRVVSLQLVFV